MPEIIMEYGHCLARSALCRTETNSQTDIKLCSTYIHLNYFRTRNEFSRYIKYSDDNDMILNVLLKT